MESSKEQTVSKCLFKEGAMNKRMDDKGNKWTKEWTRARTAKRHEGGKE